MSVTAMTVTSVHPHPNAEALRVYELAAGDVAGLVVVANLEQTYAVGDTVAIARVGALLKDGTKIRKSRLRGVDSFGMALGSTDAAPGADLTEEFCDPAPVSAADASGVQLAKWTSIELLHHVRRTLEATRVLTGDGLPRVTYRAKVKLDGTNAAIHAVADGYAAQSRTRLLTPESDNYGFAAWVHANDAWARALHGQTGRAVVYGEWCGQGIQGRTAIAKADRKVFVVFAIQLGDPSLETARLVVEPERIAAMLPDHPDVFVLPWHGDPVTLDFADVDALRGSAEAINAMVAAVEATDPWVSNAFGIDGVGEGVVLYPVEGVVFDSDGGTDRDAYAELMFKAKGEKHQVTRQRKPAQIDPEVANSIAEFVTLVVTPARLEQGLEQVGGLADMKRMGDFLRWFGGDVRKETAAEMEAAGLEWKQVAKALTQAAQRWFREQNERQ